MVDTISKEHRSWNMSRIKNKDTKPELIVRSFLHKLGYRFRLNDKKLPGKPDIVLKKYRTIIFVHGCYWHRHNDCKMGSYFPKNPEKGIEFYKDKFRKNVQRDHKHIELLKKLGWRVLIIWECELKNDPEAVINELISKMKECA